MKFLYATALLFAALTFKVSAQEVELYEKVDAKLDLKITKYLSDTLDITINPFEKLKPYAQLRSLENLNGKIIPLDREIHFVPQEENFLYPMPMAKLDISSNMPILQLENDKNYTLLIKPFK
jgi:hypothetical protein